MELQQLRCFVTVADHGSFTRAAQALVLSQPTLSLSVSKLEAEFGTELFQRTSRGVVLTSAGETLLGPARKVLESVDHTQAAVDAIHGLTTGTLTVVCFKAFTTQAAAAMSVFAEKFPTVTLRVLAPQNDDGVFAAVSSGEADIGFARDIELLGEGLQIHPITVEESVALVPKDSVLGATTDPVTLDELAKVRLIVGPRGSLVRTAVEKLFADKGIPFDVAAESEHHETSIELVRGGVGAYLSTRGGLPVNIDDMVTVRPLAPRREWPMGVVHRQHLTPAAAAFTSVALEYFSATSH
ncbi:MAG: LysR family transcriptional regulator [Rhodococcus sp. (in: high G+C Gram-positive bacteria)]|uniref:LysR family transcriptional regulator n=1 Tax=Rhodococcus sp. TaxID=1831 RepID=UPI003BAF6019